MKYFPACTITVFLLLLVQIHTQAQILNIEKFRIDKDTFNYWVGNISLGFSTKKQQNQVTTFNFNSNLVHLSRMHSYMTINNFKVLKVSQQNVVSEGYTHLRVNFFRKSKISYEPFVQFQYDLGRGLERREVVGFSLRRRITSRDKITAALSSGVMYEHEYWKGNIVRYRKESDTTRAETEFVKSTSNILVRGNLKDNVTLFFITYYQARFTHFLRPRIITDAQIVFDINKYFSFSNQFISTIDSMPILETNQFTYTFTSNLIIKLE